MSTLKPLLEAVGAAPVLPGARCRGRHHLFDPGSPEADGDSVAARHAQALWLCEHCPSLDRCEAWFLGLPKSKRPEGVVAARVWTAGRPRKAG